MEGGTPCDQIVSVLTLGSSCQLLFATQRCEHADAAARRGAHYPAEGHVFNIILIRLTGPGFLRRVLRVPRLQGENVPDPMRRAWHWEGEGRKVLASRRGFSSAVCLLKCKGAFAALSRLGPLQVLFCEHRITEGERGRGLGACPPLA